MWLHLTSTLPYCAVMPKIPSSAVTVALLLAGLASAAHAQLYEYRVSKPGFAVAGASSTPEPPAEPEPPAPTPVTIITAAEGYRTWSDGSLATSCDAYRNPVAPTQYSGAVGSGLYRVQLTDQSAATVFCDMSAEGEGWTRLNAQVASFSRGLNAQDAVSASYVPMLGCPAGGQVQFSAAGIKVAASRVRMDLQRSTVSQCSTLAAVSGAAIASPSYQYWDGLNYAPLASTCTWNGPNWSKESGNANISGLPTRIRIEGTIPADRGVSYRGNCSIPQDTGVYSATLYVR